MSLRTGLAPSEYLIPFGQALHEPASGCDEMIQEKILRPGQQAIVYKSTELPPQISEGLLVSTAGFARFDSTIDIRNQFH